jgi:hypothetical protein
VAVLGSCSLALHGGSLHRWCHFLHVGGIGIAIPRKAIVRAWNGEREAESRDFLS